MTQIKKQYIHARLKNVVTKVKQWADGSSATIQYGGQGDGQIIITSDPNEHYEARSMQITVETTDGSGIQRTVTIQQAAKQRIDISAAVVTAATQTYSGSAKTPTPTVTLNGTTIPSSGYDVAYSNNTNAGTATITVTGKGDYTGTATGTFTINKATPTYTAPTARSLTYSGSAQYLTTTGSTSHGTIQYSNDGTNWYTTRRQGTNAGSYTTYWRLIGDSNHNDIASTSISVTIAQATGSVTTAPTARDVTYTGSSQYLVTSGSGTGIMYYRYKLSTSSSWSSWSTTRPSRTSAGTYNIEYYAAASSDGNYTQSATGSLNVEMKKAASSITAAPTAKSLTYNRGSQSLVNAGTASGGTMYYYATTTNSKPSSTSSFSSSIPTKTSAGTYYVWYYVKGDSNHTDTAISSTSVSVTISKATPVISTAPSKRTGLTYTGSAQNLLSGGAMKHSSSDSTSVGGTFTYAKGTNAGTYSSLTWSFTPTDTTNYNSTSGSVSGSVTIAKASRTISWSSYPSSLYVGGWGTLSATPSAGSSDGTISYSSSNSSRASVSGSKVTAVSAGTCTIYASISEGTNYLSASTSYTLTTTQLTSLTILSCGQGGTWTSSYIDNAPIGSYCFLTNNGNLMIRTSTGLDAVSMPSGYNSLNYAGAILVKPDGATRYDAAYPENLEVVTGWSTGYVYRYNASQSTQPTKTANGGFRCVQVHLNQGDVLIANVMGGDGARAVWVMKTDYSSTIKVATNSSRADYAPICYEATENCEVFINDSARIQRTSYILRK